MITDNEATLRVVRLLPEAAVQRKAGSPECRFYVEPDLADRNMPERILVFGRDAQKRDANVTVRVQSHLESRYVHPKSFPKKILRLRVEDRGLEPLTS